MGIYKKDIARLTKNPELISTSWSNAGPLFQFVTPSGRGYVREDGKGCGCLVMIRAGNGVAYDPALTNAICRDKRIPKDYRDITPEILPLFAKYMLAHDKHFGRTPQQ